MKKIISIVLVLVLVFALGLSAYAVDPGTISAKDTTDFDKLGGSIIGVLQIAATIVAIALLLFVGIKFMMAAPAEKANLKGALIPYLVGAVLIFAAIPLVKMISNFATSNIKAS